jgi:hypothetical protein
MASDSVFSPLGTSIENAEITDGTIAEAKLAAALQTKVNDKGCGHIIISLFKPSAVIQGTWDNSIQTSTINGYYIRNETSHADGDEINYKVYLAAGTYVLLVLYRKSNDAGILDVKLDTVDILSALDTYDAGTTFNNISETTGITVSTAGIKTLQLVVDGKNGSSSNYKLHIQEVVLYRTA